ncbi:MAG TPA: AraC family transcriptional regulator [Pyrinomonadaceae bacterium]|jgi:AraC family transcriptional regulator
MLSTQTAVKSDIQKFNFNRKEKPKTIKSSEAFGWRNVFAEEIVQLGGEMELASNARHLIALLLKAAVAADKTENQKRKQFLRSGEILVVPMENRIALKAGEIHVFCLYLEPAFVQKIAEDYDLGLCGVASEPIIGAPDEQLRRIALALFHELIEANISSRFCADALAKALALQIVRRFGVWQDASVGAGGMAGYKLRKALEFVEENLECEAELSLEKIAECVEMSYCHLSRSFKQSMGINANAYIAQRRIERAKKLLSDSDAAIADIALQVGFSSQSHFTTTFRRLTGTTPKIFRRTL